MVFLLSPKTRDFERYKSDNLRHFVKREEVHTFNEEIVPRTRSQNKQMKFFFMLSNSCAHIPPMCYLCQ